MDKIIKALEAWRATQRLGKADMARLLGAPASQYYTNWIARDSLPKDYYAAATALLGTDSPEKARSAVRAAPSTPTGTEPQADTDISGLLSRLGENAKLEAYGAICRQLSTRDAVRLARILLERVEGDL